MGNLKDKIKATLLRRDSWRLSPSPSKNSFGRDYASSASTHTQPGYDASDERSDHRSLSLSLSHARALRRSTSGSRSKSSLNDQSSHAHTPHANTSAAPTEKTRQKPRPSQNPARTRDEVHHADSANDGDGGDSDGDGDGSVSNKKKTDRADAKQQSSNSSSSLGPGAAAAPAPVKTSAKSAPPPLQADPDRAVAARNSNAGAISALGKDRQTAAVNPRSTGAGAGGQPGSPGSSTIPTALANNNVAPGTTNTVANTVTVPVSTVSAALPSINEHPATPPTNPASEITSPDPQATFSSADYEKDDIVGPVDDPLPASSLLTPLTNSPLRSPLSPPPAARPLGPLRRQSILPPHQTELARALLHGYTTDLELDPADIDQQHFFSSMVPTKIWVKRPLASATLITIGEDDLVDDIRDQILRKYANSLGRQFDAPDLTLRICNRDQQTSRILAPDEHMVKVLGSYYPKGQTVDDALLIDIPSRRTPKASPNPRFHPDDRPHESGTDYFPPYQPQSHSHHTVSTAFMASQHSLHFPPSMSIVGGSQLPPLPSPGSARRLPINRPNLQRMHTASPVSAVANNHNPQVGASSIGTHKYPRPVRSRTHSGASSDQSNHQPTAAPIPTPPPIERTATPPPRVSSPMPSVRTKKKRDTPTLAPGLSESTVPPINILIVEDNIINLRLLEAFIKRFKCRWQTAVNGKEAVEKWRTGGFHLVLMDIQLPIMNGLEATREIRRIEKANNIGVFSSAASSPPELTEPAEEDRLANTEMFKSSVIIVALTASSLQSDRHEALESGCNDFLTKPVNFEWLQRKVKEWGCMQALIDFDGWRKWKEYSQKTQDEAAKAKSKPIKKNRLSMTAAA
ncbi:hypothetical protein F5Y08DRAFT_61727 [Xylaria arbuscula]|nr:hypothetical protein F5Y08DRAFT_61727 [Xylaria arbuscula]